MAKITPPNSDGLHWVAIVALIVVLITALPVIILAVIIAAVVSGLGEMALRRQFERQYGSQGRRILLVYSESPNWQEYIETEWLPRLEPFVITLNWSQRHLWAGGAPSLEVKLFKRYGGDEEFNPMAIYVPKRGPVWEIRFFNAFRCHKHGKSEELHEREAKLFSIVDRLSDDTAQ